MTKTDSWYDRFCAREVLRAAYDCIRPYGGSLRELEGMTLREVFQETEACDSSVRIFWGCWTDDQLETVIQGVQG